MYGGTKPSARKVRNIDTGEMVDTMTTAADTYPGLSRQSSNHNCAGRTKKLVDFVGKYLDD